MFKYDAKRILPIRDLGQLFSPVAQNFIMPVQAGSAGKRAEHGTHGSIDIAARRLRRFNIHIQRPVLPLCVDKVHQMDQQTGFTRLARRVQDEILACADQAREFWPVHPVHGQQGVVDVRLVGPCGVKEFFHRGDLQSQ